jgi:hypothetical protein
MSARHAATIRSAILAARDLDITGRQRGLRLRKENSRDSDLWIRAYMRTRIRLNAAESRRYAASLLRKCPECAAGKHTNCDGTTWDNVTDAPTACPCVHRG